MAKLTPITEEQIRSRIRFDNPWWESGQIVSFYHRMKRRDYFNSFVHQVTLTSPKRASVLMGPRRVGKTVLIHHAIQHLLESGVPAKKICYVSLDTPLYTDIPLETFFSYVRELIRDADPDGFFLFFDEIQYLKDWEVHLKSLVDSFHHTKFIASGSAAAALKLKSRESGAGRFSHFLLPPLSFSEYLYLMDLNHLIQSEHHFIGEKAYYWPKSIEALNNALVDYINFGGYPETLLNKEMRDNPAQFIRSDIVDKVLQRDLPSLYGIQDIQELNTFFTTLAYNTGAEVSIETLGQQSGVSKNTLRKYLEYLEAAFLIKIVHRIDFNAKRFRRANFFKVYLTNPSLRTALFGTISPDDKMWGNLVKTAIFDQWLHLEHPEIYYARWNDGEVDMVWLEQLKPAWLVEIKYTDRYANNLKELNHLANFYRAHPIETPIIVTSKTFWGEKTHQNLNFIFVPASAYCLTVGKNLIERNMNL